MASLPDQLLSYAQTTYSSFDLTGRYATYRGPEGLVLEDLLDGATHPLVLSAGLVVRFGYDEKLGRSIPYAWDAQGLRVFSAGAWRSIEGSVLPGATPVAGRFGSVVALHSNWAQKLRLVDLRSGDIRDVPLPTTLGEDRQDSVYLSADGRLLVYQAAVSVRCSDTTCREARGPVRVQRTDSGTELWQASNSTDLLDANTYARGALYLSERGHSLALTRLLVTRNTGGVVLFDTRSYAVREHPHSFHSFSESGC